MMHTINTFLPSITLVALLLALWMLSTNQTYTQNLITESVKTQASQQQQLFTLEQRDTELGVRIVRIEGDLCRYKVAKLVQCP